MRVLILAGVNSRNAGGVFNCMTMLGHSLTAQSNSEIHYLLHEDEYSNEDRKHYEPMTLHNYTIKGPKYLAFSLDMYQKLESVQADLIHVQGIWMFFSYVNKKHYRKTGTPYIITPHGMLDPWQLKQTFSKNIKKKIILSLYEAEHLKNAACIQALCVSEYEAIRAFGLTNPVAIIPNGIKLPNEEIEATPIPQWKQTRKTLLFLSRLHHKKGLENLLHAWALTQPEQHNWQLVIAGETTDADYKNSLRAITKKLKIDNTVQFIGGQFGENKDACFTHADAFILPSFSEGLPMAVLEAWSYKLPVLMTRFCNIPEGFEKAAALEIEPEKQSIFEGMIKLFELTEEQRFRTGLNGYNLVKEKFTWEKVALSTLQMYNWVLGKTEKPNFIHFN